MRKYIIFLLSVFISGSITAQNYTTSQTQQAMQMLHDDGAIVIKFNVATKAQINEDLTNIMSIDNVKTLTNGQGFEVRAYANEQEFQKFLTRNIPYEIIPKEQPKALTMATTVADMANWDRYPTYTVYEQLLANFASTYPNLCEIDTILSPTPSGNYKILVAKISDSVHTAENEPQFLYTSSMHGDEVTGLILMLRLINYLLTNYGSITQVTNLVNNAEIWICPMANPEGTYYNSSPAGSSISNSRRENLSGKDLNRNYIDPRIGDPSNSGVSSYYPIQPETYAFMNFADAHHFNMSANFHGGAEVTNYPWDTWITSGNPNADAAWWERVCSAYVAATRVVNSSYMTDVVSDGVSEGGDWYVITGGRQDYMNYFKHCREVTIELDGTKQTPVADLNNKWNENYASLLNYMQESLYGIRGIITDSCSGQPIRAKVFANSYDQANDSSHVYSALPVGNYHKYVNTGTYSITYSAPGYISKTVTGISVTNGTATIRNVSLAPAASPDAQFTATVTDNCAGIVQFTNTSTASTNFMWFFGDGSTSTLNNPTHTYTASGTYTVKLRALNCKGKDSLVRTDYIIIDMAVPPTVTGASKCGPGTLDLSASGSGTLNWYDAASGGNLVNTGSTYSPTLSSTTTYYVANNEVPAPVHGGKADNSGATSSNSLNYLIFDCFTPVTIISVQVYASTIGNRTLELRNSSGTVLQSATVNITSTAGAFTFPLNFNVAVGTNLQLGISTSSATFALYRNSGVALPYPYTIPGVLSITTTNANPNPQNYYYYCYDWLVQVPGCESSLVPVTASILTIPVAGFTSSVTTVTADFTNTSTDATSYFWDFGDGDTSNQQNPSHTYITNDTFHVMLIAFNGSCSDTVYQDVTILAVGGINDNIFGNINIYPNPVQGIITIMPGTTIKKTVSIDIFSVTGALVYSKQLDYLSGKINLDISDLSDGVYSLRLLNSEGRKYFRILKTD